MKKKQIANAFFLFIGIALAFVVSYRAYNLSFTHDESATYLFFHRNSIWELFTLPDVWLSANNHILNTILYQFSIDLLGHSDFTMRLPNVLAFMLLYSFCLFFLFPKFKSTWASIVVILILFINPYAFEFYSLCRGYGLSMCFHFMALGFFWYYFQSKKNLFIYLAFFSLFLASFSLLTHLILLPVYSLALWIYYLREKENRLHIILAPTLFSLLSLVLFIKPIYYLSQNNEFDFGVTNLWLSFESLIGASLCYQTYIGKQTIAIVTVLFIVLLIYMVIKSFQNAKTRFFALSFCLLLIALSATYFILDINFPSERKTTIYVPLLAVLVASLLNEKTLNKSKKIAITLCACLLLIHFVKITNLNKTIEWYYDANTKQAANILLEKSKSQKIIVQCHWKFHPTFRYYETTKKMGNITLMDYKKELIQDSKANFVICWADQIATFDQYKEMHCADELCILLKK